MEKPNDEKSQRQRQLFGNTKKKTDATVELNIKGGLKIKAPSSKKYRKIIKPLREEKEQ